MRYGPHHNAYGRYELARCVVEGIRRAKRNLVERLAADAAPFDPSPASVTAETPEGR
mgnify:CR=1 FL=1|jgi:hypothetical protein